MSKPRTEAIVPVWAQRIEGEVRQGSLWITGWGHIPNPVSTRAMEEGQASKLDVLQQFRNYGLRHLSQRQQDGAGVYQFADAKDDEKLFGFCREFGPVWGEVRSSKYEDNGTYTVTVVQGIEQLKEEQKRFRAAVRLLQQFNESTRADRTVMVEAIDDLQVLDQNVLGTAVLISETIPLAKPNAKKTADFLPFANMVLCGLLNDFRPKLFPLDREVIELPDVQTEGIRNAIYYPLRLDYMAQRTIGTCLHCGGHFPVLRRGARACSESCRRALRNQEYWDENKDAINRARREERTIAGRGKRRTHGTQKAR